jgi:hypothetical protein
MDSKFMNVVLEVFRELRTMCYYFDKGKNKGSPLFCIRKDPASQQKKMVLIGISSGFNYNHGSDDKSFMIFYSISFYHKWISDVITGGDVVRIDRVERNTGSSNSQIKLLFLFFSTLLFMHLLYA